MMGAIAGESGTDMGGGERLKSAMSLVFFTSAVGFTHPLLQ
jgi:hypothetical protein